MAKLKIFALRDVRVEAFLKPMFLQNKKVLHRAIGQALQDENSMLYVAPEDYQVYELGEYDEATGQIEACAPTFIGNVNTLNGDDDA